MDQTFLIDDFLNNDEISVGFYVESRDINMHSHEFYEISYVYEGRGTHYQKDGHEPIRTGEFIFLSPGVSHCIKSPAPNTGSWVRVCNMLITPSYLNELRKRISSIRELDEYSLKNKIFGGEPFCIHLKDDSQSIYRLLMTAAHEYNHYSDCSGEIITNSAASLLMYIIRLYEKEIKHETVTSTKNEVIDDLLKFISTNFGSRLTLDYLAAYAHLSPEYLSRYFKRRTGMNISDYITRVRIDKAKYRLRTNNWAINDICEYCGYQSISAFQKAFKKAVGMSAGEYRKKSGLPEG